MSAVVFFAAREGWWPTPDRCRKAADALDALGPARYGDILRAYADAEDARTSQRRSEVESHIANVLDEAWPKSGGRRAICQALARRVTELLAAEREALADAGVLGPEQARTFPDDYGWSDLMVLLDAHWPADLFPTLPDTDQRDPGPRIVSLLRWVDRLKADVHAAATPAEWPDDDAESIARGES